MIRFSEAKPSLATWSHSSGGGAPAFPTPAIETIGLSLGLGLGIAGVGIAGVGIAVCTHSSVTCITYQTI